jgi:hypothetical protein
MINLSGYFRLFEPGVRELLERGHHVHIIVDREDRLGVLEAVERLRDEYVGLSWRASEIRMWRREIWYPLIRQIRLFRDYVQFLLPPFNRAPGLVARAEKRTDDWVQRVVRLPLVRTRPGLRLISVVLRTAERALPRNRDAEDYITDHAPDVVLLSPHLMPGSQHSRYLNIAQTLGLRTAVCVASWDNLSSKQTIRPMPDVLTVWNETQKREAIELHRVPPDRIAVTGAQCYDQWFDWKPRDRETFCSGLGLDPSRPYVLYTGGALYEDTITEAEFILRWLEQVRTSGHPALRDVGVLVRPHPKRIEGWNDVDLSPFENLVVYPREGKMPVDQESRADYFDSIYHSAAVVGVNTSALIEAGIIGRRVHTVLVPEFFTSQVGLQHFGYLMKVGGGLVRRGETMEQHLEQLAETLANGVAPDENRKFVEAFIRPHGIDVPAARFFADAVEELAALPAPRRVRAPFWAFPLRALLYPLARHLDASYRRRNELRAAAEAAA